MRSEVLVGPERRRRWSATEKSALIEESLRPDASVSEIVRRHGVSRSLFYKWRRDALESADLAISPREPAFVPAFLTAPSEAAVMPVANAPTKSAPHESKQRPQGAEIEVTLPGGARITLRGQVEPKILRAVLAALQA